jgi:rhodanese-related sulfurtransferase
MEAMQALGFEEVYNMLGGITEWEEQGYPVIRPEVVAPTTTGG